MPEDAETRDTEQDQETVKPPKVGRLSSPMAKLIILVIIALALIGTTVGTSVYLLNRVTPNDWETKGGVPADLESSRIKIDGKKSPPMSTYRIEDPFKLVLYDKDQNPYNLMIQVAFGIKPKHYDEVHTELEARFSEIKDIIVQTIYSQNPPELVDIKGQTNLKIEIKNRINQVLIRPIDKVYFEDIVVSRG